MDMTLTPDPSDGSVTITLDIGEGERADELRRSDVNGQHAWVATDGVLPVVGPAVVNVVDYEPALVGEVAYVVGARERNLVPNPSFEITANVSDMANELTVGTTASMFTSGAQSAGLLVGANAPTHTIYGQDLELPSGSAGQWLGFRLDVRRVSGASWFRTGVYFYDGTAQVDGARASTVEVGASWVTLRQAFRVPNAAFTHATVYLYAHDTQPGTAPAEGSLYRTDSWRADVLPTEAAALALEYFDGAYANAVWEGNVHQSPSSRIAFQPPAVMEFSGPPPALLTGSRIPGTVTAVPVDLIEGYEVARPSGAAAYPIIGSDEVQIIGSMRGPRRGNLRLLFRSYEAAAAAEELYQRRVHLRQTSEVGLDMVHRAVGDVRLLPAHSSGVAWSVEVDFVEVP